MNTKMITPFEQSPINHTFIFIDGSYYNFHRYFSILNWWKNVYPNEPLTSPIDNAIFVDKFRKTFVENIMNMPKRLQIDKNIRPIIIVGQDCKRSNIWRTKFCKNTESFEGDYKGERKNTPENGFMGGPLFKLAYDENLFQVAGSKMTLKHPCLEADDCIAISTKYILKNFPGSHIYIMTSDKDYLQLACDQVELFNLSYKKLTEQKSSTGNCEKDLFCKIIMGDPSDNIKPVFKKCGFKTAIKCFYDKQYFEDRLKKENAYDLYNFNKKLIDFNEIPNDLVEEFIKTLENNLNNCNLFV
jgi:5'-3' exonuclease